VEKLIEKSPKPDTPKTCMTLEEEEGTFVKRAKPPTNAL
jgi:hypothetical protein